MHLNVTYIQDLECHLPRHYLHRHLNVTYVRALECHLRSYYLYRHPNITYKQALECYLRSHYLYMHLSVTYVQHLKCYLRSRYLYRHLNVTYIQALECYLRSHYLYTHPVADGFRRRTLASSLGPPQRSRHVDDAESSPVRAEMVTGYPVAKVHIGQFFFRNFRVARWLRGLGDGHWPQIWALPQNLLCSQYQGT